MKTILLVDGEIAVLETMGQVLKGFGYKVISRADAESALSVIRKGCDIDLVLTDHRLPGINGMEFISRLRQILPSTTKIILAGDISVEDYVKSLSLGVFECFNKPVKTKDLHRVLKSAFEQSDVGNAMLLS